MPIARAYNTKQSINLSPPPKKSVKLIYFFKNLLLYSRAWFRQTKYVVIMTKEGSTKIVNFMIPGAGVLVLGRGHISHLVKMHCFFKKSSSLLPGSNCGVISAIVLTHKHLQLKLKDHFILKSKKLIASSIFFAKVLVKCHSLFGWAI